MKIKKVVVEGFHNVSKQTYDFDNITYLHGRNGVGKSTVLQAIQLGLLGYVPGTNKTKQGVFTHANGRVLAIKIILEDNSGNSCSIQRVWTKVKNSVTEDIEVVPATLDIKSLVEQLELPLFNFDEFTHMTANTLKDWFINYLPKSTFQTDWNQQLLAAVKELPSSAVDATLVDESVYTIQGFGVDGVEEVRQANTYFKNQLSFMKSELQRKTATIQSLIHYDDYAAEYTEEELQSFIRDAEASIVSASVNAQKYQRKESLEKASKMLEDAPSMLESITKKYNHAVEDYDFLVTEYNDKDTLYRKLFTEHSSYNSVVNSTGTCPYTNKKCEEIVALKDTYVQKQREIATQMEFLMKDLQELQNKKADLQSRLQRMSRDKISLENDVKILEKTRNELDSLQDVTEPVNVEILQEQLERYKDMYGKAVANRQYNELNDVVLRDKYRIENTIECLKLWVKLTDVNGLQAQTGDTNPFEMLSGSINEVLKKLFTNSTARCKFNSDGKANSFSFGIERDETYVPYQMLSSGEKCLFILSMFIGLLNYSKSPLKLILIDDFLDHLDDENFNTIFQVLDSNTDIQYIFAGVKPITTTEVVKTLELQ